MGPLLLEGIADELRAIDEEALEEDATEERLIDEGVPEGVTDEGVMLGECGVIGATVEVESVDELEVVDGVGVLEGVVVDGVGLGVLLVLGALEVVGVLLVLVLLVLLVLGLGAEGTATDVEEPEPPEPLPPFSNTLTWAVSPLGTVTTQKLPPPAPGLLPPVTSLTLWTSGSILHGRPLQPEPSQMISTP